MDRTKPEELMRKLTEEQREIVKQAMGKTNQNSQLNIDRWIEEELTKA